MKQQKHKDLQEAAVTYVNSLLAGERTVTWAQIASVDSNTVEFCLQLVDDEDDEGLAGQIFRDTQASLTKKLGDPEIVTANGTELRWTLQQGYIMLEFSAAGTYLTLINEG